MAKIKEADFLNDYRAGKHREEAAELKWWIMCHLRQGPSSADVIYKQSKCGDTAMYLALHQLVMDGIIIGLSPYDEESPKDHREMRYTLSRTSAAAFFSDAATWMSESWSPEKWHV